MRSFHGDEGSLTEAAQEADEAIQEIVDWAEWWTAESIADAHDWLEHIDFAGVPVKFRPTEN